MVNVVSLGKMSNYKFNDILDRALEIIMEFEGFMINHVYKKANQEPI